MAILRPHTGAPGGAARAALPDLVVALCVAGVGVFTLVEASRIHVPLSSNVVGPQVVPYVLGGCLVVAGIAVFVSALRGGRGEPEAGEDIDADAPTDWVTLVKVVIAFAAHVLLVDTIGWALAGALLFALVSWALGGSLLKAIGVGLVLGFVVQAAFVSGLGVTLPVGPFEGVGVLGG